MEGWRMDKLYQMGKTEGGSQRPKPILDFAPYIECFLDFAPYIECFLDPLPNTIDPLPDFLPKILPELYIPYTVPKILPDLHFAPYITTNIEQYQITYWRNK